MAYVPGISALGDVPRVHGRERPDAPAIVFDGKTVTYAEWRDRCLRVANALVADGVKPGARIAILDKNTDAFFEVLFGGAVAGAVTVAANWRLAPPELQYILTDASAEILFAGAELLELAESLAREVPSIRRVVALSGERSGIAPYASWRDAASAGDPEIHVDPESAVVQMYTSGTTGHPKGVQLSHAALYALDLHRARHPETNEPSMRWNDWGPHDVSLVTMPAFHISGSGWGIVGLYNGAKNVVLPQFDPGDVLDAIQRHRVTKLVLVPAAIQMVLAHPKCRETDFSTIESLLYGASPIPLGLLQQAVETFRCGFVQLYGMTETCGAVTYLPEEDHELGGNQRMRSAGKALPGVKLATRDGEGREMPTGEVGEICILTPARMLGYWNRADDTAKTIVEGGWVRSGDAGYLDADGYLYIHDRVKDMIVSGGENIYPAEVENAIFGHPDVADVAVIGVPDDKWGEAVKAIVVAKPGAKPDPAAILVWARERIAGYKVPKTIDFVDALPRNPSGKILKRELRKPYWEGRERQVN
jgi:acyl-CoA synthetase (AMP-forming)/AMP-acid ligase II